MHLTLLTIFEAAIFALSLSVDAFTAGFAYGSKKIKISALSVQIINIICSIITGLAFLAGTFLKPYLPSWITTTFCFSILFVIGFTKLLDSVTKSIIRKYADVNREIKFSAFNFKFILNLYADPEKADVDDSKAISPAEAAAIALALSLDGIAVGFGAALGAANGLAVFLFSLVTNSTAIMLGHGLGYRMAQKISFNISWIGGIVLIALAITKLF